MRVLIIEDEPVLSRLYARVLKAEGFDVDIAGNGRLGMEAAARRLYDLCVTDIRMPEITGIQLYELWKTERSRMARRLLFITGDILSGAIQAFLKKSGRPFIEKPFTPEELVAAVKKTLAQVCGAPTRGKNYREIGYRRKTNGNGNRSTLDTHRR